VIGSGLEVARELRRLFADLKALAIHRGLGNISAA